MKGLEPISCIYRFEAFLRGKYLFVRLVILIVQ